MHDYPIEQFINVQQVEKLLGTYSQISGMACGLMDNDDQIVIGVGLQEACTSFHWNNPASFALCWRNDPAIKASLHIQSNTPFECRCQNGMVNIAIPIIIDDGKRLGLVFAGQFFYEDEPPDPDLFRKQAEEFGFDVEAYLTAIRKAPVFSRAYVESNMRFLHQLVHLLAEMGYANLKLLHEQEVKRQAAWEHFLLDKAVNSSFDAFFVIDEQLRFVYVNDAACHNLGYSREELLTMTPLDIDPGLTRETALKLTDRVYSDGAIKSFESQHRTKEGRIFSVELNATVFEFDGARFSLTTARDISERKQAESHLDLLNFALDHVGEGVLLKDLHEGRFKYVNQELCRSLEYDREELLHMTVMDINPSITNESFQALGEELVNKGSVTFETIHRTKSGKVFPVEVVSNILTYDGTPYSFGMVRDISERKKAEQQFRMFNFAFEHVREAVFLIELKQGKFLHVNHEACRSLEYDRDELVGMSALDIDPNFSVESLQENIAELLQKGSVTFETLHRTKSGKVFPVELTASIFEYDGVLYSLSLVRNITERKQMEADLSVRERQFRTLAENSPDNIARYDNKCRALYLNPEMERTLGRPVAPIIGKTPLEDVGENIREYQNCIERVIATGNAAEMDLFMPDRGEGVRHHNIRFVAERDVNGAVSGVLTIGRDITERKRMEVSLMESEERFRLLVEISPDLIFIRHKEKIIYANPAAVRITGAANVEELIGRSVLDFARPERREYIKALMAANDAKPAGTIMPPYEGTMVRLDGSTIPIEIMAIRFQYRGMECSQQIMRDITERKRAEQVSHARIMMLETADIPEISLSDAIRLMLDKMEALTNSTISFYHFLDKDQQTLLLQGWSTNTLTTMCKAEGAGRHYPVEAAGVWADAVRKRRPVIHNDYATLAGRKGMPEGHAAVIRELVVPIFRGEQIVAIIGMGNKPADYTEADQQIVSLLGDISWEIVTRKQAEEQLRERERQFRTIAENTPDNIIRYDNNCRMSYLNPKATNTIGLSVEDLLGKTPTEKPPFEQRSAYQKRIESVISTGMAAEIDLMLPDNGEGIRYHNVRFVAERDAGGKVAGVLAIGRDITERIRAEKALYEKQKRLNDMAMELTFSEERERRRLAVDLHDTLGQDLTLNRMKLGRLKKTGLSAEQGKLIAELDTLTETAINRVRRLTRLLCPSILESAGLEASLKWLVRQVEEDYQLQISFFDDEQDKPVARKFQLELYNSVRELLINVAKHARTSTVRLSVERESDFLVIQVEDDGVGFHVENCCNNHTCPADGFGLFTIRHRIMYMGGRFDIDSKPGRGTEVTIAVPLVCNLANPS